MSSISVSSLVLGSLTVEVDGSDSTLALSVLGTAPASLTIELGTPGAQGDAATIAVGTTTTLAPGSSATVANVGTSSAAVFNFGIPAGQTGATGATGPGVPIGGTDGQVLAKIDATNYNTQWVTPFALQVRNQVRNETGAQLDKGTVVYINGAAGNKVTVTKALASGDATSAQTFAVLLENIPNNQNGYAVTSGLLEGLDTSAFAAGTQLYLSPTVAGTYTSTKPVAPDHMVYVGVIERSHANQGSILVRIQNGYELDELHDVAIASKTNNDLLAYESATNLWKNKSYSTLGLLTSATAASTYYLQTNPAGYIDATALAPYLTIASAAATYQTTAGMSAYLTTATASATYLATANNLSELTATASTARTNLGLGTAAVEPATKLVPSGGTTGQVLSKASNTSWDLVWATAGGGGGGSGADVQVFTTPGTATWTKPAGKTMALVKIWAGGNGGGSGSRLPSTQARSGGAGGTAGGFIQMFVPLSTLASTVTVTVGSGGAGGASVTTDSTNGNQGGIGTPSIFGTFTASQSSTAANGGTSAAVTGPTYSPNTFNLLGNFLPNLSQVGGGGNGSTTTGAAPTNSAFDRYMFDLPTGGGGGGGNIANNQVSGAGGAGGGRFAAVSGASGFTTAVAGGSGATGVPTLLLPTTGTSGVASYFGGTGGGGGGYRSAANGGSTAGAAGAQPGGGGGGGAASDNGTPSGAGGAGGAGMVVVISF